MKKMLVALGAVLAAVLCLNAAAQPGRIEKMIKSGKTLQQVIAAQPTREFDEVWGKGFLKPEQFVEVVYSSLAPRKK